MNLVLVEPKISCLFWVKAWQWHNICSAFSFSYLQNWQYGEMELSLWCLLFAKKFWSVIRWVRFLMVSLSSIMSLPVWVLKRNSVISIWVLFIFWELICFNVDLYALSFNSFNVVCILHGVFMGGSLHSAPVLAS